MKFKELEIKEILVWNSNTLALINQNSEIFLLEIFKFDANEPSLKKEISKKANSPKNRKDNVSLEGSFSYRFLKEISNEEVIKNLEKLFLL